MEKEVIENDEESDDTISSDSDFEESTTTNTQYYKAEFHRSHYIRTCFNHEVIGRHSLSTVHSGHKNEVVVREL